MSLDPVLETIASPPSSAQQRAEEVLARLVGAFCKGKIEAIKQVRSDAGMTLKEAKDYVEELAEAAAQMRYTPPAKSDDDSNYMVFRQSTDYDWSVACDVCQLPTAKAEANYITDGMGVQRVLVVKVVGQTKLVLKMEDE